MTLFSVDINLKSTDYTDFAEKEKAANGNEHICEESTSQFRYVLVLIFFNEDADDLHQRR